MANLGDIVTRLTVDRRDFQKGLTGAGADIRKFGTTVDRSVGGGSKRATTALLELSRGAEDAAVSFGTGGLAGAIRGSANNMAALATTLNPMAGVVVGLGAAIASVLVPRLMEMKTAADIAKEAIGTLDEAIKAASENRDVSERLGQLRGREGLEAQRGKVATARGEVTDLDAVIRNIRVGLTAALHAEDDDAIEIFEQQLDEALEKRAKAFKRLETEERLLREGEAAIANQATRERRQRQRSERIFGDNIGERTAQYEQQRKIDDLYFRPERERREMQDAAVANFERFAMQRSLAAGIGGRLDSLRQQRQAVLFGGVNNRNPELATRGNAVDRIVEIAQAKRDAKQEVYQKSHLEKIDKEIEVLEKVLEELKNGDGATLRPAGIG